MNVHDLPSPSLVVDADDFEHNVSAMAAALPGERLRPHVKAFKSSAVAKELAAAGHSTFCCAVPREMEGMAKAGLGEDLLLANEVLGPGAERMGMLAHGPGARVTVAVDSAATIEAAVAARIPEVVIDVNVGLIRCGCDPTDAGRLAEMARSRGLSVRGVMGYEGHLMREPTATKPAAVAKAMRLLLDAHADVGGDLVSAGGTGTYDCNTWATEIQAGSYCLMDTEYVAHAPAFRPAVYVLGTCISTTADRWSVVDVGLKCLGMDHGNPFVAGAECWLVSDEHLTLGPDDAGSRLPQVSERVRVVPAHIDPTMSYHERMYVARGDQVIDEWPIDLRHW